VRLVDRAPVLDPDDRLTPDAAYPIEVHLPCEVLARESTMDGSEVATVALSHGVTDHAGRNVFRAAATEIRTTD